MEGNMGKVEVLKHDGGFHKEALSTKVVLDNVKAITSHHGLADHVVGPEDAVEAKALVKALRKGAIQLLNLADTIEKQTYGKVGHCTVSPKQLTADFGQPKQETLDFDNQNND